MFSELSIYLVEGLDATGKSTVVNEMEKTLKAKGMAVLSFSIVHSTSEELETKIYGEFKESLIQQLKIHFEKENVPFNHESLSKSLNWLFEMPGLITGVFDVHVENKKNINQDLRDGLNYVKTLPFGDGRITDEIASNSAKIMYSKMTKLNHILSEINLMITDINNHMEDSGIPRCDFKMALISDRYVGSTITFVPFDLACVNYRNDLEIQLDLVVYPKSLSDLVIESCPLQLNGSEEIDLKKIRWIDLQVDKKDREAFVAMRGGEDVNDKFESMSFKHHDDMSKRLARFWKHLERLEEEGTLPTSPIYKRVVVKNSPRTPLAKVVKACLS